MNQTILFTPVGGTDPISSTNIHAAYLQSVSAAESHFIYVKGDAGQPGKGQSISLLSGSVGTDAESKSGI